MDPAATYWKCATLGSILDAARCSERQGEIVAVKGDRVRPTLAGLVLMLSLSACGTSAAPPPTPTPSPAPTSTPLPTPTIETGYDQYVAWRSGMVDVAGHIKRAYYAIAAALYTGERGDYLNSEGHMQDAQDAIRDAEYSYSSLQAPIGYRYINWVMGQALKSYDRGAADLTRGIGVGDVQSIHQAALEINTGALDLRRINALESQKQWLVWLDRSYNKAEKPKVLHT